MGYLGQQPTIGAYHKLDAISTVNGQATYNLLLDGNAFSPQSANHMLVVVNGIVQSPTTNFNISGSTIVFTSNLVTGDVINEIRVFGDVLNIGTPSDATVTNAKTNFVSTSSGAGLQIKGDGTTDGTLQLNCSQNSHGVKIKSPAHAASQSYTLTLPATAPSANKALITDGSGNLSFGSAGGLVKLFQGSATSAASFEINSTYINSTYDNYLIFIDATPVTDAQYLRMRFLHSDSVHTGSDYFYETEVHSSSTHAYTHDGNQSIRVCYQTPGNATGEGINVFCTLTQVNSTTRPTTVKGDYTVVNDSASSQGGSFNGGQDLGGRTNAITGIHLYFGSGNIIMNDFAIYGVAK